MDYGMIIIKLMLLALLLTACPLLAGGLFVAGKKKPGICYSLTYGWICGQMLLWAGFLTIALPLILKCKSYLLVQKAFGIFMAVACVAGAIAWVKKYHGTANKQLQAVDSVHKISKWGKGLWICFFIGMILQLILTGIMAYEEGDDAFYIAESTITERSDTMYRINPYIGITTDLDFRHSLAPFPIWISFLARVSGVKAVTVAQVVLPMALICMCYGIYFLLGSALLKEHRERLPMFMACVQILFWFGGYSVYSAENFLLVRTSQGKAVLANLVLPFLIFLLFHIVKKIDENKPAKPQYILLFLTMLVGCLCSTQATMLTSMLVAVVALCVLFTYKKWKPVFLMVCCCVVPAAIALLYFVKK